MTRSLLSISSCPALAPAVVVLFALSGCAGVECPEGRRVEGAACVLVDGDAGGPDSSVDSSVDARDVFSPDVNDGGPDGATPDVGVDAGPPPVEAAILSGSAAAIKRFVFTWTDVEDANYYELWEDADGAGGDEARLAVGPVESGVESAELIVPLFARLNAVYALRSCNAGGCTESAPFEVSGTLEEAIGYIKASNTNANDGFGWALGLSADGRTLVIGAPGEGSNARGVNGDEANNSAERSGAVYVFSRDDEGAWRQEAYLKASNGEENDSFGLALSLSADGETLAVSAFVEDSNAQEVGGEQDNNDAQFSGAVYVFIRDGAGAWRQQVYLKAGNAEANDNFGLGLGLSADGDVLAVGAPGEGSAQGAGPLDNSELGSGAVYVFARNGAGVWTQRAMLKASNADELDNFGIALALSADGITLAVGAPFESSNAIGADGDESDESARDAGAAYVFSQESGSWRQVVYLKASNTGREDRFAASLSLSGDGRTLVVGARFEDSGIGGDENDESAESAGAAYVFVRNDAGAWAQEAYLKASNARSEAAFGTSLSLSADGRVLAIGASGDSSAATGLGGDEDDASAEDAGAVYTFFRNDVGAWTQLAFIKASNTGAGDNFGGSRILFGESGVSLSGDGQTLAVGAPNEESRATGIGGEANDNTAEFAGAAYLY